MNTTFLQSYGDDALMFCLLLSNIIIGIAQHRVIKAQRGVIDAHNNTVSTLEKVNNANSSLVQDQATHIATYKSMVNIDELEQFYNIKAQTIAENTVVRIINEDPQIMKIIEGEIDKAFKTPIAEQNEEMVMFICYLCNEKYKLNTEEKKVFVNIYFKKAANVINYVFDAIESETKKIQS